MSSRLGRLCIVAGVAALGHAGVAAAAPGAVPVGVVAALAGDRAVTILGEPPHPARVVIRGADGTSAPLATLSPPGQRHATVYVESVAASATTWAVALKADLLPDDDEEPERERGELIVSGPVAGGPSRTLAACARDSAEDVAPIGLAVAGDDVAWSAASCPGATGVRLAPAGGAPATRVAAGFHVELTPAWLGFFGVAAGHSFLEVRDRVTGAARRFPADDRLSAFALGDSGVDAVIAADDPACARDGCRMSIMRVAADGTVVRPGLAATPAGLPGFDVSPLVAGAGRVLGVRAHGNGVVAVDLATGAVSYAGALGLGSGAITPLAVDATDAAYTARRCDGTDELRVEPTVPSLPARLSFVACPVRVLARTLTLRRGRRIAQLPILCPRGCDEEWGLSHRGTSIGSLVARAPAGVRRTIGVSFENLRPLRHVRRLTATLSPDRFALSHPLAERQAPIRILVRVRR